MVRKIRQNKDTKVKDRVEDKVEVRLREWGRGKL
jgi:hypothetical protein